MSGLGHTYWNEVIEVLRVIIPHYNKVNRAISFGRDNEFRLKAIRGHIFPGETILDAGSGFGNMTDLVLNEVKDNAKVIMYDPLRDMLDNARNFLVITYRNMLSLAFSNIYLSVMRYSMW